MSEQLIMDNYLLILKSTVEVYVHGTLESSNSDVRETLKTNLNEILSCQANTYDKMTTYGWYPVNNVAAGIVEETLTEVKNQN